MTILEQTKQLCQMYGIKPARAKGQNFLISENVYDKIIQAARLSKDDTVLEVGPGFGFLTMKMAQKVKKVVAVEVDRELADVFKTEATAIAIKNIEIVHGDILSVVARSQSLKLGSAAAGTVLNLCSQPQVKVSNSFAERETSLKLGGTPRHDSGYKIVANLPYNITSIFLRKFLSEVENKPHMMVLMLQKEVVERILAKPGQMSLLAVSVQFYAQAEKVMDVPKENFWPQPQVESAIIKLQIAKFRMQNDNVKISIDEQKFFRMVKIGFSAKRKQLQHNLAAGLHIAKEQGRDFLKEIKLNEKARPQELSLDDWHKLYLVLDSRNML
ncbi:MAG: rRNA adenine dimethyltransferase family protein [bacterium]|nr:rRNA adenine dimethyltransferase family protein [bacterium]